MNLSDCDISHLHVRGHNVALITGSRGLSDAEAAALLEQFTAVYGIDRQPAYVSRDGWQLLAAPVAGPLASRFAFDEAAGIVQIDSQKVAADVLDFLTTPSPDDVWYRVVSTDGGVTTIMHKHIDELAPPVDSAPPAETKPATAKGKA